ncbi:4-hydroxy-tetrahydrodipicolinate synthase [Methylophilus glucosoxydans]|uniref:4-hydroxy-tetrahydrodipicolinate synthase n=1 Tax=Methylophilus glucosoxydans TaxID=752553 RepID=A0ABW3GG08_9PROT
MDGDSACLVSHGYEKVKDVHSVVINDKTPLEGIWVPLVTPFKHGELDLDALKTLTQRMVNYGVHGLVVCSTTGEMGSLRLDEQLQIIRTVQQVTHKKMPILIGLLGTDTRALVHQAQLLDSLNPFGFLIAPPSFIRPSQEGLFAHFSALADAISSSIVLYNIPARAGVPIHLETVQRLANNPTFIGIKESSGNSETLYRTIKETNLRVMCGDDSLILDGLLHGAAGAISASAHIHTESFLRLYELAKQQKCREASQQFAHLETLIHLLFKEPNPAPVKTLLGHQGLIYPELRLPMTDVTPALKKELIQAFSLSETVLIQAA